jgi:hypothetical protein
LSGEHAIAELAVTWTFPAASPPFVAASVRVAAVGDVQGDGLSDLALTVTTGQHVINFEGGFGASPVDSTFLVAGRTEPWPSGAFDSQWAAAAFVVDESEAELGGCSLYGSADLNGDGFTDLLLQAETERRLVLGGERMPTGTVAAFDAGDAFELPGGWLRALPDLNGDGSQEFAWTDILNSDRLYVSYGGADLDLARLVEPRIIVAAQGMGLRTTAVTDLDGDGTLELLVVAGGPSDPPFGLYRFAVEGLRDAGEVGLERARRLLTLPGAESPDAQPVAFGLDAGGDVNGDGIEDLLIATITIGPTGLGHAHVRLLAGGAELGAR